MHSWICKVYAKFVFGFEGAATHPRWIAGGGRRKRHHTFFFQINLQVNSASGFGRFVEARAVSAICVVSGTAEQLQIFLPKEVWCLFLLVDNPAVLDLCLAAQILTGYDDKRLSFFLYEHE